MKNIVVEGHRGYCAKYPENTMASFKAALALGVDAIEFDIWLSKDKVPVIIHDGNAYRTCGIDKHVNDMMLDEIKNLEAAYVRKFGDEFVGKPDMGIPTLEELLIYCKEERPDVRLGVEIKEFTEETVDLTVALLKKYGFFDDCYFYAFNGRIIKYLKTQYNGRTMGYPDFQMGEFDGYDHYCEIGLGNSIVKSEIADIFIAKKFPMHMYCADNEEDVRLFIEKGADLITANDPVPLLKYLKRL